MTKNQIAYHSMREEMRSNREKEAESRRHNIQTEAASFDANAAKRYSADVKADASRYSTDKSHQIAEDNLAETRRHNIANEAVDTVVGASQVFKNTADGIGTIGKVVSSATPTQSFKIGF